MRKNKLIIFLLAPLFLLSACQLNFSFSTDSSSGGASSSNDSSLPDSSESSESSSESFESDSYDGSESSESSSESSESETSSETSSSQEDLKDVITYDNVDKTVQYGEQMISFTPSNFYGMGTYSTGNFIDKYDDRYVIGGLQVEFYRARQDSDEIMTLLPFQANNADGSISGAFYNVKPLGGLSRVVIEYKTYSSLFGFNFSYSEDNLEYHILNIEPNVDSTYVEIEINEYQPSYFRIETVNTELVLNDIRLFYTGSIGGAREDYISGDNDYRFNPVVYSSELIDGVSSVTVPTDVVVEDDGRYEIISTKTYTYYSTSYVLNNPSCAADAMYVEPSDVAAYTVAFGVPPANYFYKNSFNLNDMVDVFGDATRYVSSYSRTDGYVNDVPYRYESGFEYLECDIDMGGIYIIVTYINRGVGRVVVFLNGFNANGYDDSPVAVYTDDHYCTFQEYYNDGTFGLRFNVQCSRTSYIRGDGGITTYNID